MCWTLNSATVAVKLRGLRFRVHLYGQLPECSLIWGFTLIGVLATGGSYSSGGFFSGSLFSGTLQGVSENWGLNQDSAIFFWGGGGGGIFQGTPPLGEYTHIILGPRRAKSRSPGSAAGWFG